mmetsp:Transcript_25342/g.80189  ORF Transcript_25342/g.80189 Transcript_25342/m.80189 type:complete len:341 (+) Transcript_25342:180-1202(+)
MSAMPGPDAASSPSGRGTPAAHEEDEEKSSYEVVTANAGASAPGGGAGGEPARQQMEVLKDGEHYCEHVLGTAADLRWMDNDRTKGLDLDHHTVLSGPGEYTLRASREVAEDIVERWWSGRQQGLVLAAHGEEKESARLDAYRNIFQEMKERHVRDLSGDKGSHVKVPEGSRLVLLACWSLAGAELEGAKLCGDAPDEKAAQVLRETGEGMGWSVSLAFADLSEANLHKATLAEADLGGATLIKAFVPGATLHKANLEGATLAEANLKWAVLTKACCSAEIDLSVKTVSISNRSCTLRSPCCTLRIPYRCPWPPRLPLLQPVRELRFVALTGEPQVCDAH